MILLARYDVGKLKNKMIQFILILSILLVIPNWYLYATPPARVELPDPVTAYITFPASRGPDRDGNFEVEIYCKSHCDIESVEIVIRHSEEIVFNDDLPAFNGKMKAGETKIWRISGLVKKNAEFDGMVMPASISLGVNYPFPYKGMLKYLEKYIEKKSQNNSRLKQNMKETYMRRLEEKKGRTMYINKALPVRKPETGISKKKKQ
ncbi:MAG: hypothetical protein JRF37_05200 [Deltaproteobacteria bacterium]|nr:hypothetical protein [Deltaproteobacteria bacterium]